VMFERYWSYFSSYVVWSWLRVTVL